MSDVSRFSTQPERFVLSNWQILSSHVQAIDWHSAQLPRGGHHLQRWQKSTTPRAIRLEGQGEKAKLLTERTRKRMMISNTALSFRE